MTKKKEPQAIKEPKKADLVVFAFRLPAADRDAIHKAAGPGRATKFVHAAALAAARADSKTFENLVNQAKTNLK